MDYLKESTNMKNKTTSPLEDQKLQESLQHWSYG